MTNGQRQINRRRSTCDTQFTEAANASDSEATLGYKTFWTNEKSGVGCQPSEVRRGDSQVVDEKGPRRQEHPLRSYGAGASSSQAPA